MKNAVVKMISLAVLAVGMICCKNEKTNTETAELKEVKSVVLVEETFKAIPSETFISWDAKKIIGGHNGTINASTGVVNVKGGKLIGGNFILDINNTLKCLDIPADNEKNAKLIGHLKAEDFFNVAKHPNAAFQITSVKENAGKNIITGNLTIKGIKKAIEFPASIAIQENKITISSEEFTIDRTDFGINFKSGKFTDPAKLGDYLIKDNVGIKVSVVATK